MKTKSNLSGFTILQISMVLATIALILGAFVSQNMVKAASVRASMAEIEKMNAAISNFQGKYGALPGDITINRAIEYNLATQSDENASGSPGLRDGNSLIEGGALGAANLAGETALIWRDLGASRMLEQRYDGIGTSLAPRVAVTQATVQTYLPASTLGEASSYFVYAQSGRNAFFISAVTAEQGTGLVNTSGAVSPAEAKSIDEKIDDGLPTTGTIRSMANLQEEDATTLHNAHSCMNGTVTPKIYNVAQSKDGAADAPVCKLQMRASF